MDYNFTKKETLYTEKGGGEGISFCMGKFEEGTTISPPTNFGFHNQVAVIRSSKTNKLETVPRKFGFRPCRVNNNPSSSSSVYSV